MSDQQEYEERLQRQQDLQKERQMDVSAEKTSQKIASEEMKEVHKNPEFIDKMQDLGISAEGCQWVLEKLPMETAGGHALGNRGEEYADSASLLAQNSVEMAAAESSPGRLLKENPAMHAISIGLHHKVDSSEEVLDELESAATPKQKRVLLRTSDLLANHKSKAQESRGLDAASVIQTERKEQQAEEAESTAEEQTLSFLG